MRIGVFVSETWGDPSPIDEIRLRARRVEAAGLPAGWVPYLPWALDALAAVQAAGRLEPRVGGVVPVAVTHDTAAVRGKEQSTGVVCPPPSGESS